MNSKIAWFPFVIVTFLAACSVKHPSELQTYQPAPSGTATTSTPVFQPANPGLSDYPLEQGNTWIYDSSNYEVHATRRLTATYTITETVIDATAQGPYWISQINHEEQLESSSPGWSQPSRLSSDFWYVLKDNHLYRQDHPVNVNEIGSLHLDYLFPLTKGAIWCSTEMIPIEKCVNSGRRTVLEGSPRVEPSGRFSSCLKIDEELQSSVSNQWFCPGIGVVERQQDHPDSKSGFHQSLTSFSLSPGNRPAAAISSAEASGATTPPRWLTYETALADAILGANVYPPGSDKSLCEWEIWGQTGREVYVWAECQVASTDQGTAGSVPAVIYLNSDGSIQQVIIPGDGFDYGLNIQQLFPPHVQNRIFNMEFDAKEAMQHIAYRRSHPGIPPAIVESGIPLP